MKKRQELKERIKKNNLMMRFIREIEKEDVLDVQTLKTMLVFQPIRN